jgi:hypothetical protein
MKTTVMRLMVASALAIVATGALAQSFPAERHNVRYYRYPTPAQDTDWQYRSRIRRPNGYVPDARLCTPGLCQEDPYY